MSYIKPKKLWCKPVADAATYVIYLLPVGTPLIQDPALPGYIAPVAEIPADPAATDRQHLSLVGISIAEGTYDVKIAARDSEGNEGDPLVLAESRMDFTAPTKPEDGGFE